MKGLYTPHSWRLIGLFVTQCPACEKMLQPIPKPLETPPLLWFFFVQFVDDPKALQPRIPSCLMSADPLGVLKVPVRSAVSLE